MPVNLAHPSPVRVERSTQIMRYMDVGKFYDLLATEELHFARLDQLRNVDPREGRLPDVVRKDMQDLQRMSLDEIRRDGRFSVEQAEVLKKAATQLLEPLEAFAGHTFIHCWHSGHTESMAMWNSYAGRGAGVAVRSTVGALCDSLNGEGRHLVAGAVKYIDPHTTAADIGNTYNVVFRKHECFEFEREFRLAFSTFGEGAQPTINTADSRTHIRVRASPKQFVSSIVASPNLPAREVRLIEKLASDFGMAAVFERSRICFDPRA